jgi:hypothetical protein
MVVKTTSGPWNSLIKKVNLTLKQSRKECPLKRELPLSQKNLAPNILSSFLQLPMVVTNKAGHFESSLITLVLVISSFYEEL